MAKGKKREGEKKKPPKSPGKPGAKDGSKDKKHCHAFDFGKGTCRFGAKCRYLHEKGSSGAKAEPFSPEQKKLVTTLLSSAMKRTTLLSSEIGRCRAHTALLTASIIPSTVAAIWYKCVALRTCQN
jgi:hypothetical protein